MATAASYRPISSLSDKARHRPDVRRLLVGTSEKYEDTSTTPTEDPLRILAPGQKKLTNIESQRILGVVDEAMKRLDYAQAIPYLASNIGRFSVSLGSSLVTLLEEYNSIAREYDHLSDALELDDLQPLNNSNIEEQMIASRRSSSSISFASSYGHPVKLDPLENTKPSLERLQRVRFKLKMNVKCILRELNQTSLPSSILFAEKAKGSSMIQESMGSVTVCQFW